MPELRSTAWYFSSMGSDPLPAMVAARYDDDPAVVDLLVIGGLEVTGRVRVPFTTVGRVAVVGDGGDYAVEATADDNIDADFIIASVALQLERARGAATGATATEMGEANAATKAAPAGAAASEG